MQSIDIELPESFTFNRRRFFKRSEIEHLKNCLIAKATGATELAYRAPIAEQFVNASVVARELGISRRTMARRIQEAGARKAGALSAGVETGSAKESEKCGFGAARHSTSAA